MTNRKPTTRPGWWRFFLAVLVAVFVGVLGATSASAVSLLNMETRVAAPAVGVVRLESPTVATCAATTYSYDTTLPVVHIDSETVAWRGSQPMSAIAAAGRSVSVSQGGVAAKAADHVLPIGPASEKAWTVLERVDAKGALHTCGGGMVSPPPMRSMRSR